MLHTDGRKHTTRLCASVILVSVYASAACSSMSWMCWCAPESWVRILFFFNSLLMLLWLLTCSSLIIHAFHVGCVPSRVYASLSLHLSLSCVSVRFRKTLPHGERHAVMLFPGNHLNSWSGSLDIETRPSRALTHRCNAVNTTHSFFPIFELRYVVSFRVPRHRRLVLAHRMV